MKRDWVTLAACGGMADASFRDADPFFPEGNRGQGYGSAKYAAAKAICDTCLVRPQCMTEALAVDDMTYRWGMWAGTEPEQRRELDPGRRRRA